MSQGPETAGGMLIVAEYFDREDDRFVDALRHTYDAPKLAGFVDRWKLDPRPWARRQIFRYLDEPLNVPGHHVIVKRLFKQAEQNDDHEQMAAFLATFDRLIRRIRMTRYDWNSSPLREVEYLGALRDVIDLRAGEYIEQSLRTNEHRRRQNPAHADWMAKQFANQLDRYAKCRLFSHRTRRYLQRRAWRYFRKLGFQRPQHFVEYIVPALLRFRDNDSAKPENLLDSWGLIHACFGKHPAIEFSPSHARVKEGRSLAELTAVPYFEPLWKEADAWRWLWKLLVDASSRTVRLWARQMIERHHAAAMRTLSVEGLLDLLGHDDPELQQYGATLLGTLENIDQWPIATWLQLLDLRDPTALAIVCDELGKRVSAGRLDLAQTLELTTARATPVARLGLQFLRERKWESPDDRRQLTAVGGARCAAVAGDLAKFTLGLVGSGERYERDVVVALFDNLLEPMRAATTAWFTTSTTAQDDPTLWSRLIETPFDDVRLPIITLLQHRAGRPRIDARDLAPLWSSVLLAVHRGGRQKSAAVQQLVAAIVDDPSRADALLPVLGVAIRSIRVPEQRAGLAGTARLVELRPELLAAVERAIPELSFATK